MMDAMAYMVAVEERRTEVPPLPPEDVAFLELVERRLADTRKVCPDCGKFIEKDRQQCERCIPCTETHNRDKNRAWHKCIRQGFPYLNTCDDCGVLIEHLGAKRWYCDDCKKERRYRTWRGYHERNRDDINERARNGRAR